MTKNADQKLLARCNCDELIAVRDRARRAVEQGDPEAGFVLAWMNQALQACTSAATPITTAETAMAVQRRR